MDANEIGQLVEVYLRRPGVKFKRTRPHDLPLPAYETDGAAAMDLRLVEDVRIEPLSWIIAPTGWAVEIPQGFEGQIRLRSSAAKQGIIIPNAPGTIDADYRGEIGIMLRNLTLDRIEISIGMRVAQLVIAPVARAQVVEVEELSVTDRGVGGFGSTGAM